MRHGPPCPVKALVKDVTGARALDTIYQNLKGRPILVVVSFAAQRGAINEMAYARGLVGPASPPTIEAGAGGFSPNGPVDNHYFSFTVAVAHGHYYEIEVVKDAGSLVILLKWVEVEL